MSELRVDCGRQPSGWSYVVTAHVHLLVRLDPGDPCVETCREAALQRGVDGVLEALLAARTLAGLPDLTMVEVPSRRVVARGLGTADAQGAGPTRRVQATGRSPWVDVDVDDQVTRIELNGDASPTAAPEHTSRVPRSRPEPTPASPAEHPAPRDLLDAVAPRPPAAQEPQPSASSGSGAAETAAPEHPAPEESGVLPSYDHLFGETGRVPAAVPEPAQPSDEDRDEDDGEDQPPVGGGADPAPEAPAGLTLPPPADTRGFVDDAAGRTAEPEPTGEESGTGLIASVPWSRPRDAHEARDEAVSGPRSPRPVAGPRIPIPERPQPTDPPAAPAPAPQASAAPPAVGVAREPSAGSDPELTIDRSTLPGHEPISGPIVIAVLCQEGHPSPPHAARCRSCGSDIPRQDPRPVPRPVLGVLRLSTGDTVTLDRGVLMGRSPRLDEDVSLHEKPNLLRLPSPHGDISRNHVEVVLDGWQVMVRDLGSTNGTLVTLPGAEPVRLRPQDLQLIDPGTSVALSPDVSFTYELGS